MKLKIISDNNNLLFLNHKTISNGLQNIRYYAKEIKIQSNNSIPWSEEFPPSDRVISCFINAVNQLNAYLHKKWNTPTEFISDIEKLYPLVIQYKLKDLPWGYNLLNIGGSTIGKIKRILFLHKLHSYLTRPLSKDEALDVSIKTFYRMLKYQAQLDGNTRVASLVANLVLLRNGLPPFILNERNAAEFYSLCLDIKYGNLFQVIKKGYIIFLLHNT